MRAGIDPMTFPSPRILILGGTHEASRLATILANNRDLTVITSLAGRLSQPHLPAGIVRIGGFGGPDGLTSYLREEAISAVLDVTHPFAAQISRNAEQACRNLDVPLLAFERPAWERVEGDLWMHVADVPAAAALVNKWNHRIFLSIGRQQVGAFAECRDAWFLIRAIDYPTDPLPPRSKLILERGGFDLQSELKMLREESIEILITKNSGGTVTYPKIEAARKLGIRVIMIDRPAAPNHSTFSDLGKLVGGLAQVLESSAIMRSIDAI
ncbi:Cobalt-precorrin-6x reductase [Acidisarcina polymorpha]|uniref:Cobalt-precorrin-6x reductase n=1 Tax=Acidisarcina polymorpha TaxID=2211140 RepID=A0A2Z5G6P0_9BACT|nr:cobalt-precorrin-6A reductase [Acidisarcina polymorpha]AXC14315.1 Cobalt-precorrin-6x reductase [Acidisarcina polymorpha]